MGRVATTSDAAIRHQQENERSPCDSRMVLTVDDIARHARSQGAALDAATRGEMEARLGADLGDVRIHTNHPARTTCQKLGAKAITIGPHIFLDQGEYNPHSVEGRRLLAHELTHVVQQRGDSALALHSPAEIRTLEHEADQVAQGVERSPDQGVAAHSEPVQHTRKPTRTHPGVLLGYRREGEGYRDCINRGLGDMGLEIHIGWIAIAACGIVATLAGVAGAEAGAIPPAVFAAALCLSFATGVEVGILAGIIWECR